MFSKNLSSGSKPWNFGMALPSGGPPIIKMSRDDLERCPTDGDGTFDNPKVIWAARLTNEQRQQLAIPEFECEADLYRAIDANTDMAKTAAIRAGCTIVWIICPVHTNRYVYDADGNRIPLRLDAKGNAVEFLVEAADPHLTVKLGTSEDLCHLHGHINVKLDERGFPTDFMKSFQRRQNGHLANDDDRTMELFEWGARSEFQQKRLQNEAADYKLFKERTVSQGQNWEIEDDEDDRDYVEGIEVDMLDYDSVDWDNSEPTGLSPEFEEYLVRRWSPYREKGHGVFVQKFGYNTRKFRNYNHSSNERRPYTPTSPWHGQRKPYMSKY